MRQGLHILLLALVAAVIAAPAQAGPVGAAIGGLFTAVKGALAAGGLLGTLAQIGLSIGLSLLQRALLGKPAQQGITTDVTTEGESVPMRFVLGITATAGHMVAPPETSGDLGRIPNATLTYVLALGCIRGQQIQATWINGERVTFAAPTGGPAAGKWNNVVAMGSWDGSQTAANSDLVSRFAGKPRPWAADMIGRDLHLAVLHFVYNRGLFTSLPQVRMQVRGIPLYDPRLDSTAGGSGAQRFGQPATYAWSGNPAVMIYNILRGIRIRDDAAPGGWRVWGGRASAGQMPAATWFAAMNACDMAVALAAGGTEPAYRAGIEVDVSREPAEYIEQLLTACSGQLVERAGIWRIQVGAPALPVHVFTDDDVLADAEEVFEPFPRLDQAVNAISARYPDPAALWETKEAPQLVDAALVAEDGDRLLPAEVTFAAAPYPLQVQRLMKGLLADHRRHRRHQVPLGPRAAVVEPLDTVAWTSARNGYAAKVFEVTAVQDEARTLNVVLSLRERDPADYAWATSDERAVSDPVVVVADPPEQVLVIDTVDPVLVTDGTGGTRRPGLTISWTEPVGGDIRAVFYEIRTTAGLIVATGAFADPGQTSGTVTAGIVTGQAYEMRLRPDAPHRPTAWTDWQPVTAPVARFVRDDIADGAVSDRLQSIVMGEDLGGATDYVVNALSIPSRGYEKLALRSVVFDARTHGSPPFDVELQRRLQIGGGPWGAWGTIETWSVNVAAWTPYTDAGNLPGGYTGFEYRLVRKPTVSAYNGLPVIRRSHIIFQEVAV